MGGFDLGQWLAIAYLLVFTPLSFWYVVFRMKIKRPRPDNYVGKFRRPDGTIVHVARMPSGRLWAASDTQPPQEIGYVAGRELVGWRKLSTTPDG